MGWLAATDPALFVNRLGERGFVSGRNVELVRASTPFQTRDETIGVVRRFIEQNVDLIRSATAGNLQAALDAGWSKPIVFASVEVPTLLERGIIETLVRPGRNVTGIAIADKYEITAKALDLLIEAFPTVRKVAIIREVDTERQRDLSGNARADPRLMSAIQSLIDRSNLTFQHFDVASPAEISEVFSRLEADAVLRWTLGVALSDFVTRIVAECRARAIPTFSTFDGYAKAGGFLGYFYDTDKVAVRSADYIADILSGSDPATLPVEIAQHYTLTINRTTMRALTLMPSQSFLNQVTHYVD